MQYKDGTRWMVLGASPSAPEFHMIPDIDVVASAGDGILLQRPDYYFLTEEISLDLFESERFEARMLGTKVVLNGQLRKKIRSKFGENFVFPCDEYIDEFSDGSYMSSYKRYRPGQYAHACAGCLALQWAVNHGATEVHMVGMEGYAGGVDYFDGRRGNDGSAKATRQSYRHLIQRIVDTHLDIKFFAYGKLVYSLDGDNVSLIQGSPSPAQTLSCGFTS